MIKSLVVGLLALTLLSANTPAAPKLPSKKEFACLVKNVYYEARGESPQGKQAVAKVTLNRVKHKNYPKSICGVVYQKRQFSWTIKPSKAKIDNKDWLDSMHAATKAYNSTKAFPATHYHNFTVRPRWGLKKVAVIGNHIFYI